MCEPSSEQDGAQLACDPRSVVTELPEGEAQQDDALGTTPPDDVVRPQQVGLPLADKPVLRAVHLDRHPLPLPPGVQVVAPPRADQVLQPVGQRQGGRPQQLEQVQLATRVGALLDVEQHVEQQSRPRQPRLSFQRGADVRRLDQALLDGRSEDRLSGTVRGGERRRVEDTDGGACPGWETERVHKTLQPGHLVGQHHGDLVEPGLVTSTPAGARLPSDPAPLRHSDVVHGVVEREAVTTQGGETGERCPWARVEHGRPRLLGRGHGPVVGDRHAGQQRTPVARVEPPLPGVLRHPAAQRLAASKDTVLLLEQISPGRPGHGLDGHGPTIGQQLVPDCAGDEPVDAPLHIHSVMVLWKCGLGQRVGVGTGVGDEGGADADAVGAGVARTTAGGGPQMKLGSGL